MGTEAATEFTIEANTPEDTRVAGLPQATRRRDRIKLLLGSMIEQRDKVLDLVREAQGGEDHRAFGYASWTAYLAAEFGGLLAELNRDDKRAAVQVLAETGMSVRAIAPMVGLSKSAVARDTSDQVSHRGTPADEQGEGQQDLEPVPDAMIDASEEEFETALSSARADDDLSLQNVVKHLPSRRVTSPDGKGWTPPSEPAKPRRRPLPDAYQAVAYDALKVAKRLSRLHQDDRFSANRDTVRQRSAANVAMAANELGDLLDDLGVDRHRYGGAR